MTKKSIYYIALSSIVFFLIFMLILFPLRYSQSIKSGFVLFLSKVAIFSFPFIFLSKLLINLSFKSNINFNFFSKIYNCSPYSFNIFILSLICGYPMNTKYILDYYNQGLISKCDAKKILSFTSLSNPIFIIATIGASILKDAYYGYILYISHVISALLNGLIYKNIKCKENNISFLTNKSHLTKLSLLDIMLDTIKTLLVIGGFITIFYMLIDILIDIKAIKLLENFFDLFLENNSSEILSRSIFEITRGVNLATNYSKNTLLVIAGCVSFGGACIICQSYAFLSKMDISILYFLLSKTSQSLINILVIYLLLLI